MQPRIAAGGGIRPEDLVAQMAEVRWVRWLGRWFGGVLMVGDGCFCVFFLGGVRGF